MNTNKKFFLSFIVIACTMMLFALPVLASDSVNNDDEYDYAYIEVLNIDIDSKSLKPGNKLEISAELIGKNVDGEIKLDDVKIRYVSSRGQKLELPMEYNADNNKWYCSFKVSKGMQKGIWRIRSIVANDRGGYEDGFGEDEGNEGLGLECGQLIVCRNSDYYIGVSGSGKSHKDLSKADFRISGTKADYKSPKILLKNLSASLKVKKGKGKITYRVKVTDGSPIKTVKITTQKKKKNGVYSIEDQYIEMKYNKKTGYYECTLSKSKGSYVLESIVAQDIFGNYTEYLNKRFNKSARNAKDFSKYNIKF